MIPTQIASLSLGQFFDAEVAPSPTAAPLSSGVDTPVDASYLGVRSSLPTSINAEFLSLLRARLPDSQGGESEVTGDSLHVDAGSEIDQALEAHPPASETPSQGAELIWTSSRSNHVGTKERRVERELTSETLKLEGVDEGYESDGNPSPISDRNVSSIKKPLDSFVVRGPEASLPGGNSQPVSAWERQLFAALPEAGLSDTALGSLRSMPVGPDPEVAPMRDRRPVLDPLNTEGDSQQTQLLPNRVRAANAEVSHPKAAVEHQSEMVLPKSPQVDARRNVPGLFPDSRTAMAPEAELPRPEQSVRSIGAFERFTHGDMAMRTTMTPQEQDSVTRPLGTGSEKAPVNRPVVEAERDLPTPPLRDHLQLDLPRRGLERNTSDRAYADTRASHFEAAGPQVNPRPLQSDRLVVRSDQLQTAVVMPEPISPEVQKRAGQDPADSPKPVAVEQLMTLSDSARLKTAPAPRVQAVWDGIASRSELSDTVTEQLGRHIINRDLKAGRLAVQLNPRELGLIELEFSRERGEVHIAITPRESQTRELLEATLPKLKASLGEAGVALGDLSLKSGTQQERDRPESPEPRPLADPGLPSEVDSNPISPREHGFYITV